MTRRFAQVDVFGASPGAGNPVAVVLDAEGLSTEAMQAFARWTNLSETTFVLPGDDDAGYAVRIFTPDLELPFAGHPTLGTAHAWREATGATGDVVQRCGAGLVPVRETPDGLAFAAPPRTRSGPPSDDELAGAITALGLARDAIIDAAWCVNGPQWLGLLLRDADAVLRVPRPVGRFALDLGLAGLHPDGTLEVRAFFPQDGAAVEDPVTGSLNAALAQWLSESGRLALPYTAHQGRAIGRDGRVALSTQDGAVWVAGATATVVRGTVEL